MSTEAHRLPTPLELEAREKSLFRLVGDVTSDSVSLVTKEVRLFRLEAEERLKFEQRRISLIFFFSLVALSGFLALIASLILALAHWIDPWVSALVVGGVLTAGGVLGVRLCGKEGLPGHSNQPLH